MNFDGLPNEGYRTIDPFWKMKLMLLTEMRSSWKIATAGKCIDNTRLSNEVKVIQSLSKRV
jgi:hypothetical protein